MRLVIAFCFAMTAASAEEIVLTPTTSENLLPGISSFTTSGDATITGNGQGCQLGQACTGAAGGTYSTTVDLTNEMTIAEINAGFDLAYGVTVNSHSSNATLPTCDQTGGDCQDNFNLTLTLQDGATVVETYEHEFVLDYAGLRDYQFEQTVVSNAWVELSMLIELYGQDAGYPTGLYGPQFTDPWLTAGYDAISFVQNQIIDVIQDDMDDALDLVSQEFIEAEILTIPEDTFVVDAEEIFSNPVLSEIIGTGDTVTVTLTEVDTGDVIDSFEIDVQSQIVTDLPVVSDFSADADFSSFDAASDFAPPEPMGFGEQPPNTGFTEVLDEMPGVGDLVAELDMPEPETVAVETELAEIDVPEMADSESLEIEVASSEVAEPDAEVAAVETAEQTNEPLAPEEHAETSNLVASSSDEKPENKASVEEKSESRKQRIVKKISTRVMATLSKNYEAAMQGAALSVMRMSAPTYRSTGLQDLEDWYAPVEFDGGTNYDHPSALWIAAQASKDMSNLVKMQWRK